MLQMRGNHYSSSSQSHPPSGFTLRGSWLQGIGYLPSTSPTPHTGIPIVRLTVPVDEQMNSIDYGCRISLPRILVLACYVYRKFSIFHVNFSCCYYYHPPCFVLPILRHLTDISLTCSWNCDRYASVLLSSTLPMPASSLRTYQTSSSTPHILI